MQRTRISLAAGALASLALAGLAATGAAQAPLTTQLVSVDEFGNQLDQPSGQPDVNPDGSVVAYHAHTLKWTGGWAHMVFLFEPDTGLRTSVVPSADGACYSPRFSDDGRYLVFDTSSRNLDPVDSHIDPDIYLYDTQTKSVEWVSIAWDGSNTFGAAKYADASDHGLHVAFQSQSFGLTQDPDTNPWQEIFVRNRVSGQTVLVSRSLTGTTGDGLSNYPVISGSGRYVAFSSSSSDYVVGDTNAMMDVFVADRDTDGNGVFDEAPPVLVRVSLAHDGSESNNSCIYPSISSDGRFVAWESWATNLVPEAVLWGAKIYRHDRDPDGNGVFDEGNGTTELVSRDSLGNQPWGSCSRPELNHDGSMVTFYGVGLVANPPSNYSVYVRDLDTKQTRIVSVDSQGTYGNGDSGINGGTAIAGDGSRVAFYSTATNLVPVDTNDWGDVFVHTPCDDPGIDLGYHMATSAGDYPIVRLCGPVQSGKTSAIQQRFGPANQAGWFLLSGSAAPLPIFGGTLVPSLVGMVTLGPYVTDSEGRIDLLVTPPAVSNPIALTSQWVTIDLGLPEWLAFSNGLAFELSP